MIYFLRRSLGAEASKPMKKFLVNNLIFLLLLFFGGISAEATSAQGGAVKSKVVKKQKKTRTPLKTAEMSCSTDGCVHLKEGKELLEGGLYDESIKKLKEAYEELPVVGDYALFFMAKAYAKKKEFGDSDSCIDEILGTYPYSALKKRARALAIRNKLSKPEGAAGNGEEGDTVKSFEKYLADYPEDLEMTFLLGTVLKEKGEGEKAKKIFREVYVTTSPLSASAHKELGSSDITADDLLAKASNYIKDMEHKKAEALLRKAFAVADEPLREDILKKLGLALFRQKRYREAAVEFSRAGDTYNAARSLYRAGDLEDFSSALSKLISMEDRRAGSLLIALASKKRREGKTEEALKIYADVRKTYPSHAEEALWGIAWTCYRTGDYEKASKVLSELNAAHPNTRYLYWKMRCEANAGEKAIGPFPGLLKGKKRDFYSLLTEVHESDPEGLSYVAAPIEVNAASDGSCPPVVMNLSEDDQKPDRLIESDSSATFLRKNPALAKSLERFGILTSIGMKEDAVSEVLARSGEFSSPDVLLYLGRVLKEAEAYKSAIALISRLSRPRDTQDKSGMNIDDILYPLAYWPIVGDAAASNKIDPLLLLSIMREESRFDPGVRSAAGAIGLMQLMPQTAYRLSRHTIKSAKDIYDVKTNIAVGAFYLGLLLKEFRSLPVAVAAYNAGEERVREWLKQGDYRSFDEFIEDIPYDETRNYVRKVLMSYSSYKQRATISTAACAGAASE